MKEFFKMVFATIVGIFLFSLIIGLFAVMSLVGMVASGSSVKSVDDNSVMVLKLTGDLEERSQSDVKSMLMGGSTSGSIGLDDVLSSIKKAKSNDDIKGIYIEAGMFSSDSYASLQAIRRALDDFKKSGKWVVAYADTYTQGAYYLASVANKVYINPQGMVDWHGIASTPIFLKDALAKFGVKIQLSKVGTYKSAPEMFTADHMSDANREQVTAYINGIWENVLKEVSASRNIPVDSLNKYADEMVPLASTEQLMAMKLVDGVCYTDEVKGIVKKLLKIDEKDDINQLSLADMSGVKEPESEGEQIAVYYAFGDIVDGDSQSLTSDGAVIDAQVVCKDLEKLTDDDDVKAVVLRVNSGGGSAYASEQIWHQVELLKQKKPVVVSMGGMAASGGYYISCNSNWIVAEPTTLTGSIGIFGMFPDFSGLLKDKLGVKFDEVKTNKNSAFGTRARPFNEEEMGYLNTYIDRGYKLFRQRVADGRKLSTDAVEAVAQGRVWLGQDALKHKLVDQLGSLDDAVAKAAKLAKLDKYYTESYPAMPDFFEQLMSSMDENTGSYLDKTMRANLGEYYEPLQLLRNINRYNAIQARIPYQPNIH
ncbi:MAG: signal peptide peptidase SppA [Prevotella sp.]|nr:signal peptide peptidase SppA [Prevotella sp.]